MKGIIFLKRYISFDCQYDELWRPSLQTSQSASLLLPLDIDPQNRQVVEFE